MIRPATALLCTAFALAAPLPAQDQPDHLFAEGEQVQVVCWFYSERTGQALPESLVQTAEWVLARSNDLYGADPDTTLGGFQLFVYWTRKGTTGYTAGVESVAPGASAGTLSFAHWPSRTAHVRMRPFPGDRALVELGIPIDCMRRAAAAVADLGRVEIAGGEDLSPRWFAQGASHYLATRALVQAGLDHPGDQGIWLGTQILAVRRLIAAGQVPILEDLLADRVPDLDPSQAESLRAVFFEFLAQFASQSEGWSALCSQLTRGLRGEELGPTLSAALGDTLGERGVPGLEVEFHRWLADRRPLWNDIQPALQRHSSEWAQSSVAGNAQAWRTDAPPPVPYRISGEFRVFLDPKKGFGQANVLFGRLGDDFLQVAIHSQHGMSIMNYSHEEGVYETIATGPWPTPFQLREWHTFEVLVTVEDALVTVGSHVLTPCNILGRDMTGPWGVGTFKGSTTLWRNLKVEGLE